MGANQSSNKEHETHTQQVSFTAEDKCRNDGGEWIKGSVFCRDRGGAPPGLLLLGDPLLRVLLPAHLPPGPRRGSVQLAEQPDKKRLLFRLASFS